MNNKLRNVLLILALIVLCVSLVACTDNMGASGENNQMGEAERTEVKIGIISKNLPVVEWLQEELEPLGYDLKIVVFEGNQVPARALNDGEVDSVLLNQLPWLKTFNEANNSNLHMVEPYLYYSRNAVYSSKHKSVDEIPQNAQVALPSDPANMDRTLKILSDMGLITLGEKTDKFYSILDIIENPKNITIIETERSATVRAMDDVDLIVSAAVEVMEAGFDHNSFIFEGLNGVDYPHGFIIQPKDIDSDWVKEFVRLTQTDEFRKMFNDYYDGTHVLF